MQGLKKIIDSKQFKFAFPLAIAIGLGGLYAFNQKKTLSTIALPIDTLSEINQSKYLTQIAAELRWIQIKQGSISYNVDLLLKKGTTFHGLLTCDFVLNHNHHDLFIDYRGEHIQALFVNDQQVDNINWNKLFIRIPKELLKPNQKNRVNIQYTTKYASDGCGLHSFTDADGKQYLYSQGESYFCNRFFPCMDQPDLKAILRFTTVTPKEWAVISNENPTEEGLFDFNVLRNKLQQYIPAQLINAQYTNIAEGEYKQWVFGTTKLLPTYLFAIISGEYWSIKNEKEGVPQTIYCRESLKEHMMKIKDFVFQLTRESMLFYEQFFGVKYQFSKYDSVFVPEYNWGAMENPGCVTFNDVYVFREAKPATSYTQFANTIAHEMAHHWFGDYVTMKWWNDLWLNESYADFISHFCLENISHKIDTIPLCNIPVMFNMRKGWGYREDQMVTTHPIAGAVHNTEQAENIFDGITYSKGAATMKQLLCIMGAEKFGLACGNYFQKFGWQNARLDDLINCLQEKFDNPHFTLKDFQQQWIEKAGMNEIEAVWNPTSRNHESEMVIVQRAALQEFDTLRIHKLKVGLFREDGSIDGIDVILKPQEETKLIYNGSHGYRAIILNYEDQSFVKVLLDQFSLKYFEQNLYLVKDVLTRTLIYRALFDTVRDGKISSEEYVDFLLFSLPREDSDEILNTQLLYLQSAVSAMTPRKFKKALSKKVFTFIVFELKKELPENKKILLRNNLFSFSYDDECIDRLVGWWKKTNEDLAGVELTNDSKWAIVRLVHASKKYDNQQDLRKELLDLQLAADKSDTAKKVLLRCKALTCTAEERKQLWAEYCDPLNKESAKLQAESMSGFNNWRRFPELIEYHDKFFEIIKTIFETKSTDFAKTFYDYLFPETDDLAQLCNKIQQVQNQTPESMVTLRTYLAKSLDSVKRQVKQFECFCNQAKMALQPPEQDE